MSSQENSDKVSNAAPKNLLPEQAYAKAEDQAHRDRIDEMLKYKMHLIPTDPGKYFDSQRDPWILNTDGSWTDKHGLTRSAEWTPMLAMVAPFTIAEYPKTL